MEVTGFTLRWGGKKHDVPAQNNYRSPNGKIIMIMGAC